MAVLQPFPNIVTPIANVKEGYGTGRVGQGWLQLFISLWNRTGAAQGIGVTATGMMMAFGSAVPPDGWQVCDGSPVSRTDFAALFSVIGTTWGIGDGTTTFNLPNLIDRFLVGAGAAPVGGTGGNASVTLTTGQLPAHNHGVNDPGHIHAVTDPGHVHTSLVAASTNTTGTNTDSAVAGNTGSALTGLSVNSHTTGITTNNTGSGDAVPTVPPFAAAIWIIKT